MKLIILGSSAAIPTRERNLAAIAFTFHGKIFLFDCGEDVQRRFNEANLKFNKPLTILISHFHGDHIIGMPGLFFRFGLVDRTAPVHVFGPPGIFFYLFCHRVVMGLNPRFPLIIHEIDDEKQEIRIYEGLESDAPTETLPINGRQISDRKRYFLEYAPVKHSVLTYAYSFIEKPRPGKFNPERARQLEVPEGRLWGTLQQGKTITYKGKEIDPIAENIVGPKRPGKKITYSSDTAPCNELIELGRDSDVIIHEATFTKALADVAQEKLHSTSVDAARDALEMGAKQLIITHISSRYKDAEELLQEAQEIFPNTILAEDLKEIKI